MRILDRYLLQKFLLPFVYCFIGFIAVWFLFDLSGNLPDFLKGKASLEFLREYYKSQIPEIIVVSLPIGALLALLYSLTAMSRSNEIVSILGAGVSVVRFIVPLIFVGLLLTAVTAYFNYEGAPHAAKIKKRMLRDIKRGKTSEFGLTAHLYRNREDRRTWFSRRVYAESKQLTDVQIIQQDADGNITKEWYAREADYDDATKRWSLQRARYVEIDSEGKISKSEMYDDLEIRGWRETPWRIASSVMDPDYLSVPELKDYLLFNDDFPEVRLAPYRTQLQYRWALPWVCLLVVFIAAPLGIVYSRRGVLGAAATAIGLFFSLVFFSNLFVALGKGNRLSPWLAIWGPMLVYFLIGLLLLWYRSTNRDVQKVKFPWMS